MVLNLFFLDLEVSASLETPEKCHLFGALPQTHWLNTLGVELCRLYFSMFSRGIRRHSRFEKHWGVGRGIQGVGSRVLFWPLSEGEHRASLTIDGWLTWGVMIIYEGPLLSGAGFSGKALWLCGDWLGEGACTVAYNWISQLWQTKIVLDRGEGIWRENKNKHHLISQVVS